METFAHPHSEALRQAAIALPEVTEGTSCVNRAFKVRGKAFLYVGEKKVGTKHEHSYVMLKLADSLGEAGAMDDPRVSVGKIGWVTLRFPPSEPLDADLLARWVVESYRTMTGL